MKDASMRWTILIPLVNQLGEVKDLDLNSNILNLMKSKEGCIHIVIKVPELDK